MYMHKKINKNLEILHDTIQLDSIKKLKWILFEYPYPPTILENGLYLAFYFNKKEHFSIILKELEKWEKISSYKFYSLKNDIFKRLIKIYVHWPFNKLLENEKTKNAIITRRIKDKSMFTKTIIVNIYNHLVEQNHPLLKEFIYSLDDNDKNYISVIDLLRKNKISLACYIMGNNFHLLERPKSIAGTTLYKNIQLIKKLKNL